MTDVNDVVIVDAVRTAIGSFAGGLATVSAAELGATCMRALISRVKVVGSEDISDVIMGQVLTAGVGQNPARQAAIKAGIPHSATAITINQVCGSGLRAVAMGMQAIKAGDASIVIAGGQENMSLSPHAMLLRTGTKMGNAHMTDTMVHDGLWDCFNDYHMGITAENVAKKLEITRKEQDEFATVSQYRAANAMKLGRFKEEIIPVTIKGRKGDTIFNVDEFPRADTTVDSLSGLRPAFDKNGTVTAGNASGINDGAAAVLLMTRGEATRRGLAALGTIVSWATAGVDPSIMGTGPIPASKAALEKAKWTIDQLDLIEANEAFAAQAIAVNRVMGWDIDKVNVNGGAIALGHPIGASGARVLTTLLHEMKRRRVKRGLATLCIGGGMGIAMCVES